jgi:hypothetical protein
MQYSIQQQRENRRKWVEALRSGKFKQGNQYLEDFKGNMCCLGIGCRVLGVKRVADTAGCYKYGEVEAVSSAPPEFREMTGLQTGLGMRKVGKDLSELNDSGTPFSKIADIIESEPAGLFVEASK